MAQLLGAKWDNAALGVGATVTWSFAVPSVTVSGYQGYQQFEGSVAASYRAAVMAAFDAWAREASTWPNIDKNLLEGFRQRMFGGNFIFSVTSAYVRACTLPTLLMPGNDVVHPAEVSAELARAPNVEVMDPWKGASHRDEAMRRVRDFLIAHRPPAPGA